jgi:hypothetical protein
MDYFSPKLAGVFEFALRGDRDQTLRIVREGGGEIARLYRLGIHLSHGQALQLGRQIRESLDRERSWVKESSVQQPLALTARLTSTGRRRSWPPRDQIAPITLAGAPLKSRRNAWPISSRGAPRCSSDEIKIAASDAKASIEESGFAASRKNSPTAPL